MRLWLTLITLSNCGRIRFDVPTPLPCTTIDFTPLTPLAIDAGARKVVLADLNGDDWLDAIATSAESTTMSVSFGNGHGGFGPAEIYATGVHPWALAVGEIRSNRLDIAVGNFDDNSIRLFANDGSGRFTDHADIMTLPGPEYVAARDLDRDGNVDLLVTNNGADSISVFTAGPSGFSRADYAVGVRPYALAVTDFDRDSRLDVVVANAGAGTVSVLLGGGDGSLRPQVVYASGPTPTSMAWHVTVADVDRDGVDDVITANNYSSSALGVLHGRGDGTFDGPQGSSPAHITRGGSRPRT